MTGSLIAQIQTLVSQFEGVVYEPFGHLGKTGEGLMPQSLIGAGDEFHSFRPYVDGDDVRQLDLSSYARTQRLWTRQFSQERTKVLHLVLDGSASMGVLDGVKWRLAIQIATVLKTLCLRGGHEVIISVFDAHRCHRVPQTSRGGPDLMALNWLEGFKCVGESGLDALAELPEKSGGELCLISDFMWSNVLGELEVLNRETENRLSIIRLSASPDTDLPAQQYFDPESDMKGWLAQGDVAQLAQKLTEFRRSLHEWSRRNGLACFDWSCDAFTTDLSAWLLMRQRYLNLGVG